MKKMISFAVALLIVAGCGGNVMPDLRASNTVYAVGAMSVDDTAASDDDSSQWDFGDSSAVFDESSGAPEKESESEDGSSDHDDNSSMAEAPAWSESEDEAKARALDYNFDTVMVFKDGTEKKLDIDYDVKTEKNAVHSYKTSYVARLSREEAEKLFADMGKTYGDVDRVEYRMTVSNGKDTDYSDDYNVAYRLEGAARTIIKTQLFFDTIYEDVVQPINSTVVFADKWKYGTFDTVRYDELMFDVNIIYSWGKVYMPTEDHKKAMMVEYSPKIALMLKDGTEIMTDLKAEQKSIGYHDNYIYTIKVDMDDIKKYITDAGRTMEEYDYPVGYISTSYPAGQGIKDDSVIKGVICKAHMRMELLPKYEFISSVSQRGFTWEEKRILAKSDGLRIQCGDIIDGIGVVQSPQNEYELARYYHIKSLTFFFDIDMRDAEMSGYSDAGAVKGDVTGDGKLNVTDLSKAAAAVKGVKPLPDEQRAAADVNSDGILNVTDVSKIAASVKGIRPL